MCSDCMYAIKNPVCTNCFLNQVNAWLIDQKMPKMQRGILLKSIAENLFERKLAREELAGECIICNNDSPVICSYCFFQRAASVLKEINLGDKQVEEFLDIFNYRHYEDDYLL